MNRILNLLLAPLGRWLDWRYGKYLQRDGLAGDDE